MKKPIKKEKNDYSDLENLFNEIERTPKFKRWFGTPCPEFQPLCANCDFWNKWNRFKQDIFKGMFQ